MLIPRRVKHRKQHHPDRHGAAKGGTRVTFGEYGIQALEPAYVTNRQIESARIAITRHIRRAARSGSTSTRTARSPRSRPRPGWVPVRVRPSGGSRTSSRVGLMFELSYPNEATAKEALTRAIHKLPMKCRIVTREVGEA